MPQGTGHAARSKLDDNVPQTCPCTGLLASHDRFQRDTYKYEQKQTTFRKMEKSETGTKKKRFKNKTIVLCFGVQRVLYADNILCRAESLLMIGLVGGLVLVCVGRMTMIYYRLELVLN